MHDHIFLSALLRGRPDVYPTWLMRQAGRSMAAYRAMREEHSFIELAKTPALAAEVTAQPVEGYGVDAAILFSDIMFVLQGLDFEVDFNPGPVVRNPVRSAADVRRLGGFDIDQCCFIIEAVREAKVRLDGTVPLIGFTGGPLTLAAYAMEGGAIGDMENTRRLYSEEPEALGGLLDAIAVAVAALLEAEADAGADVLMIFDTWAARLGAEGFNRALPHVRKITDALKRTGKPVIYMARDTKAILGLLAGAGADAYAVDWTVTPAEARSALGGDAAIMGNLDPAALLGTPDEIEEAVHKLMEDGVVDVPSLGHGVRPDTPEENVGAFVRAVHSFGRRR